MTTTTTSFDQAPPQSAHLIALPRHARPVLVAGALLGLLAELLFDGYALGVSFPLFCLALTGALASIGGRESWQRARHSPWLLAPALFFAAMAAVRTDELLLVLNVLAALGLLLLCAHLHAGERLTSLQLGDYLGATVVSLFRCLTVPPTLLRAGVDLTASRAWMGRHGGPVLRGLLIAAPVLAVFGLLLCMADDLFARLVAQLLSGSSFSSAGSLLRALLVSAVAAFLACGWLGHALRRAPLSEPAAPAARPTTGPLGFVEGLTVLGSVGALFSTFITLQVGRLLRVLERQLSHDFTYSNYARRGFFELIIVSLLSLALIMALHRMVRRESPVQERTFRFAGSALVALVLVLLGIALQRMSLYEEAYGATRLRLFSHLFIYALGAVLLWRGLTLWWGGEPRFALGALTVGLAYCATLNLLNPDGHIARYNLERYAATGKLDVHYLASLSEDALPVLTDQVVALEAQGHDLLALRAALSGRLPPPQPTGWPALHLGHWRAAQALQALAMTQ